MAYSDYITLDGKKYKVVDQGADTFKRIWDRQKIDDIGLTGLTILQDFTVDEGDGEREPRTWNFQLRVFINDPWPDNSFGVWANLLAAQHKAYVTFVEHDGVTTHEVTIRSPIIPIPRVGANIDGHCHGIDFVDITMVKVYRRL